MPAIGHRTIRVSDVNVLVRTAGDPARPTLVLLHGFPSSSRHYIRLLHRLADHWHVVAPGYPGFGLSDPLPGSPAFDRLAEITGALLDTLGVQRYALYLFDFGAPVGFRVALAHVQRVQAVITQNANACTDGFGPDVAALASWWNDRPRAIAGRDACSPLSTHPGDHRDNKHTRIHQFRRQRRAGLLRCPGRR